MSLLLRSLTLPKFLITALFVLSGPLCIATTIPEGEDLKLSRVISTPQGNSSVQYSGHGLFLLTSTRSSEAISFYDREFRKVAHLSSQIRLSDYNVLGYTGSHTGAAIHSAFSPGGEYAYVLNRQMKGPGVGSINLADCYSGGNLPSSFLYRISLQTLEVDQVVQVGSLPHQVAATSDGSRILATNQCSGDLSIIDTELGVEIERIGIGDQPTGIALDQKSRYAYVTVKGQKSLAVVRLVDFSVRWISGLPDAPGALVSSPEGRYLYMLLHQVGQVVKFDLVKESIVATAYTGRNPQHLAISPDGSSLYVSDYQDATLTKVSTQDMQVVQSIPTRPRPMSLTFDPVSHHIWVACESGSLMVFEDQRYVNPAQQIDLLQGDMAYQSPTPPPITQAPGTPGQNQDPLYYLQRDRSMPTNEESATAPAREFFIVVGSYASEANAQRASKQLHNSGYQALVLPDGNGRFRVCTHKFHQEEEAESMLPKVKESVQAEAWILSREAIQ